MSQTMNNPVSVHERALRALSQLPPFSPILNKLLATLANEDVSFAQLAELIEKDSVLAGNVLRLVNSALYGRRGTINSVRHAISIMGLAKLRNTAMSLSVSRIWHQVSAPADWSPAVFNLHCVAVALMADLLAQHTESEYPEGAFTGGLLHDVGMLLIAVGLREEFQQTRKQYLAGGRPLADCEREILGLDHAELSAEALSQWNLPMPIQQAVRYHHQPPPSNDGVVPLARVLEAADLLARQLKISAQDWLRATAGEPQETLATLGLGEAAPAILEEFDREFRAMRVFFR